MLKIQSVLLISETIKKEIDAWAKEKQMPWEFKITLQTEYLTIYLLTLINSGIA